ncbi:Insulin-degrading enzyme [Eumeta japonica]|uniref:Insulin-degrading enzyme n=1 Tax=Eumeta variegata TaxID=151549 RepID=A0A4C1T8Z6_EUMVA|nr:Insulin-degrading enzyme [Eumeta japonica]
MQDIVQFDQMRMPMNSGRYRYCESWHYYYLMSTSRLTVEQLEEFARALVRRVHVEGLLYGNFTKERALNIADMIENKLPKDAVPLLPQQLMLHREVELNEGVTANSLFQPSFIGDGWGATVSDAPLPLHFIGGASVAHGPSTSQVSKETFSDETSRQLDETFGDETIENIGMETSSPSPSPAIPIAKSRSTSAKAPSLPCT